MDRQNEQRDKFLIAATYEYINDCELNVLMYLDIADIVNKVISRSNFDYLYLICVMD